jgi:hypothetical protein
MVNTENNNPSTSARLSCYFTSPYESRYWKFIDFTVSLNRGLKREENFHIHHIIPKSMGGNNSKGNLVKLTIREHLFAHLLLAKTMISPHMICAYHFMKRNEHNWNEEMSSVLGRLISRSKQDLDNSASVRKGWDTWKNEAEDYNSRFFKAWNTRRKRGNDKVTDFSPEAKLKRSEAAKKASQTKLANPNFDGSTPVIKGWETRRKNESEMSPEELYSKVRDSVNKCNETKRKNGTFKRSKESIEKQKRTNALKRSNSKDDIV